MKDNDGCAAWTILFLIIAVVVTTFGRISNLEKEVRDVGYDCRQLKNEVEKLQRELKK